jgi:hypothetical protein
MRRPNPLLTALQRTAASASSQVPAPQRKSSTRAIVFCAAALALSVACSDGPSLASAMLDQPPNGYRVSSASGTLDADSAPVATPAESRSVAAYLKKHALADGYSTVWVAGSDFVTIVALRFNDNSAAAGLVQLEVAQLKAGAANVTADASLPNASTYVLFGKTRLRGHDVFCAGEAWPEQRIAFLLTTCSALPNSAAPARQLAVQQYLRAEKVLRLDVPVPAPEAT